MNCCRHCFEDLYLKEYIEKNGQLGDCAYCGAQNEFVMEAADLEPVFERFTDLYCPSNDVTGEPLADLIESEWSIFNDDLVGSGEHHNLLQDIMTGHAIEEDILEVPDVRELWIENLPSESLADRWEAFSESLKERPSRIRYRILHFFQQYLGWGGTVRLRDKLNDPFVWASEDLSHVAKTIPPGNRVFRARLRFLKRNGSPGPLSVDQMGAPPPKKATAGRANPERTRVLYCAEEEATAVTEMRPARGQLVSVASGETIEQLRILDFAEKVYFATPFACSHLPSLVQSYQLFNGWGDEFAKPLRHSDDVQDYYPTQYLAQWISSHHYDGIRYPSALATNGHNLVLFDPSKVRFTGCRLVEIKTINVQYGDLEPEG